MDKCLRPQVFDTDVNAADSSEKIQDSRFIYLVLKATK